MLHDATKKRTLSETSQGSLLVTLLATAATAPFLPAANISAPAARSIYAESSRGMPKTLYTDFTVPFKNIPYLAPDRVHHILPDTSVGPNLLLGIPAPTDSIDVVQPYIVVYFWKRTA